MIDKEALLLSCYTDTEKVRRLIQFGLKEENVELLGNEALKVWRFVKGWYQRNAKAPTEKFLLDEFEQYVKTVKERGDEEDEPDLKTLVQGLQRQYLHKRFKSRIEESKSDGTFSTDLDFEESLEKTKELSRDLLKITVASTTETPLQPMAVTLAQYVDDTLSWEERVKSGEAFEPITFGFEKVDEVYQGIRPGELVVMAAYTKIGKSFLLCKCALAAALKGRKVALWSLENSEEETFSRLTALQGRLPYDHVNQKTLSPGEERQRFKELVGQEVFNNLYVKQPIGTESATLEEMYWESFDQGIELFVGDQLSHVYYPSMNRDPDWLAEEKKLLQARSLSKETGMASIWASQLNIKAAKSADPDSTMMARSQGIVKGADLVFYLSDPTKGTSTIRKLACGQNRRGPTVDWELVFNYAPMDIEAVAII